MKQLKAELDEVREVMEEDQSDFWLVITGRRGSGKSTLAIQICQHFDPTFDVNDIVFTSEEFKRKVHDSPHYKAILVDEACLVAFSKEHAMKEVREIVQEALVCRFRRLFIVFNVPKLKYVESSLREDIFKGLLHVKKTRKNGRKRRIYMAYSQKWLEKILDAQAKKRKIRTRYKYREEFFKVKGNIWKEYEERAVSFKKTGENDVKDESKKYYKVSKLAKKYDCTSLNLKLFLENKKIEMLKHGDLYYLDQIGYNRLKNEWFS